MKRLDDENRHHRKHPARTVGTVEWCQDLKRVALEKALDSMEKTKMTAADALLAMKIRKNLLAMCPKENRTVWEDPRHWCDLD